MNYEWVIGQDQTRSFLPASTQFSHSQSGTKKSTETNWKRETKVLWSAYFHRTISPCSSSSTTSSLFSVPLQAFGDKIRTCTTLTKLQNQLTDSGGLLLGDRLGAKLPAESKATSFVWWEQGRQRRLTDGARQQRRTALQRGSDRHRKGEPTVGKPARRRETAAPPRLGDERRLDLDEPAGDGGAGVAFPSRSFLFNYFPSRFGWPSSAATERARSHGDVIRIEIGRLR